MVPLSHCRWTAGRSATGAPQPATTTECVLSVLFAWCGCRTWCWTSSWTRCWTRCWTGIWGGGWTGGWISLWAVGRTAAGLSHNHSGPVCWPQLDAHLFQAVSHAIVDGKSSTFPAYSPQLLQLYVIRCWSVNVSSLLGSGHCVLSFCYFVSIFLVCLVELNVSYWSVFFLHIASITAHHFNGSNFWLSLIVHCIFLLNFKVNSQPFKKVIKSLTLSTANLGRANKNSLTPFLSSNPPIILQENVIKVA